MFRKIYRSTLASGEAAPSNTRLVGQILAGYLGVNLIGLALAHCWGLERALFNLDYLLAALVYLWVSRSVAALCFTALFVMEIVRMLIPSYFFTAQAFSVLFWLRAARNWSGALLVLALAAAALLTLVLAALFRRQRLSRSNKITATVWVLATLFFLIAADLWNGTSNLRRGDTARVEVNVASSPAYLVVRETWETLTGGPATFTPIRMSQSATGRYFSELQPPELGRDDQRQLADFPMTAIEARLPEKIVLVVFESLSVLRTDEELRGWLAPFQGLADRYQIESGAFDWAGATRRGEFRELCWQALDGIKIETVPIALPERLKELRYESVALHGFHETMYDRNRTYPKLGFDRSIFLRDMSQSGTPVPLAGTLFCGAQDTYVAQLVGKEIRRPGKRLVYWMTLSSHIPVNVSYAEQIATPAENTLRSGQPSAIWAYQVICDHTLESIAALAADKSLGDCDFVIVGDHALPVIGKELKQCIVPNRVPYLILRHRRQNPAATEKTL